MDKDIAWQTAWKWLCRQRKKAPANSDIWHLRFHWARDGDQFRQQVEQGRYRLKPMRLVNRWEKDPIALWDADDAMVLKWVALQLTPLLPLHPRCHNIQGAGVQHSLRTVKQALWVEPMGLTFVYRTDIKGYYQHIRKSQLAHWVRQYVQDPVLWELVRQFIYYSLEEGGTFSTPETGICRGCALSPLLGSSLLYAVDEHFARQDEVFYVRYMDDFLLLTARRWPLRRAIKQLNAFLEARGFVVHPDKTQIGRVERGFDWLGVWFNADGTRPSPRALQQHQERCRRLSARARALARRRAVAPA